MKKTKTRQTEETFVDSIICNKCGKEYRDDEPFDWDKIFEFKIVFGYGSKRDGSIWEYDICEDCLCDFVKTFDIPVSETSIWE